MVHDEGPWYDKVGLVFTGGIGGTVPNATAYEGTAKVDIVKGKVPGTGVGATVGIIGVGLGTEVHAQGSQTVVLTIGDILRFSEDFIEWMTGE